MGFQISPGVDVNEIDLTTIVPAVSTTEAAIGGVFMWGPVDDRELVSSENELVLRYGKPTNDNFETFYSASNFLSYGNKLYVSRAADANAFNATAGNGVSSNTQIKNVADYESKLETINANAYFVAKYPGALGNSLKISVCDSAASFSSIVSSNSAGNTLKIAATVNSDQIVVSVTNAVTTGTGDAAATTALTAVTNQIKVGDFINVGSPSAGFQAMKVKSIGASTTGSGVATAVIRTATRFYLAEDVTMTTVRRYWEYYQAVDGAPGTTTYASERNGSGDELHIVVVDEDGAFTGTPENIIEVWEGVSRATDAKAEQGGTLYFVDVLNRSSLYVWCGKTRPGVTTGLAGTIVPLQSTAAATYSFTGGTNTLSESAMPLSALARAYDQFKSSEHVDVSIIIGGKAVGGAHGEGLANYIIDNILHTRYDCVGVFSPQIADVVNNPYGEEESVIEFRNALRSTSYAMLDSGYKYQYDRYNDIYRWIPLNADVAGTMVYTDDVRDPWYSNAGFARGNIKNVTKLAYNPDKADRDQLYKNGINPVVTFPGSGTVLYGDKTLLAKPSAFDRINVRRLFIVVEKAIAVAAKSYLFEFNNEFTRASFRNLIEPFLRDVQGRNGIYDFKVICDETNNTGEVIDRNELVGDIYIKPARSINFIKLNFIAVRTAVDFNEVIGNF